MAKTNGHNCALLLVYLDYWYNDFTLAWSRLMNIDQSDFSVSLSHKKKQPLSTPVSFNARKSSILQTPKTRCCSSQWNFCKLDDNRHWPKSRTRLWLNSDSPARRYNTKLVLTKRQWKVLPKIRLKLFSVCAPAPAAAVRLSAYSPWLFSCFQMCALCFSHHLICLPSCSKHSVSHGSRGKY